MAFKKVLMEGSVSSDDFTGSDGSANQVLKTDGSGTLSWTDQSGGGGGGVTISNNANNRVLTGDGTNANAESALEFDGQKLALTSASGAGSLDIKGGGTNPANLRLISNSGDINSTDDWKIQSDTTLSANYLNFKNANTTRIAIESDGTTNFASSKIKVGGSLGSDGQVLTSTGSGCAWEDASGGGGSSNIGYLQITNWVYVDYLDIAVGLGREWSSSGQHTHTSVPGSGTSGKDSHDFVLGSYDFRAAHRVMSDYKIKKIMMSGSLRLEGGGGDKEYALYLIKYGGWDSFSAHTKTATSTYDDYYPTGMCRIRISAIEDYFKLESSTGTTSDRSGDFNYMPQIGGTYDDALGGDVATLHNRPPMEISPSGTYFKYTDTTGTNAGSETDSTISGGGKLDAFEMLSGDVSGDFMVRKGEFLGIGFGPYSASTFGQTSSDSTGYVEFNIEYERV